MREILKDKNFIAGKIILLLKILLAMVLAVFFLPLLILPFYNHACTDDYFCAVYLHSLGFWKYQEYIYTCCGGRFFATFTGSLFAFNDYLYSHYYTHTLLLLSLNFASLIFLISVINRFFFKDFFIRKNGLIITLIFLALTIGSLPQAATYLFWFSSAITYQLPVILMQLEAALFILVFYGKRKSRPFYLILICLLITIINGFNELFIVVQFFLMAGLFYFGQLKKISKLWNAAVIVFFIVSAFIVFAAPGNILRAGRVVPKSIFLGAVSVAFNTSQTFWSVLKNPLFWFMALLILIYGNQRKEKFLRYAAIRKLVSKKWLFPLITIAFPVMAIAVPVAGLKGGIIPERYMNGVSYFLLYLLLINSFLRGMIFKTFSLHLIISRRGTTIAVYATIIIMLLCNEFIADAYQSIIAAPVYDDIMHERENTLKKADKSDTTAVLETYNFALGKMLQNKYADEPKALINIVKEKPRLLFFEDDLDTDYSIAILKKFYKVENITVKRN